VKNNDIVKGLDQDELEKLMLNSVGKQIMKGQIGYDDELLKEFIKLGIPLRKKLIHLQSNLFEEILFCCFTSLASFVEDINQNPDRYKNND